MKTKLIAIVSLVLSLGMGGVAHADSTVITNTGAGSVNNANFTNTFTEVVNDTNVGFVTNDNGQTGGSGAANVNDNTSGGSAISGDVVNSNSFSTVIAFNNTGSSAQVAVAAGGEGGGSVSEPTLPRTGALDIDRALLNALLNAREGIIAPLAKTGGDWSWSLTALAGVMALATTYGFSKLSTRRNLALAGSI